MVGGRCMEGEGTDNGKVEEDVGREMEVKVER